MQSYSHRLSSRSSSATLHLARQIYDGAAGTSDDVSIAQGLLNDPTVPHRQSSFLGTSPSRPQNRSSGLEGIGPNDELLGRRADIRSSTTWTSSSGGFLSDQDDMEDRTEFLHEYNRLARKHGVRTLVPEASMTFRDGDSDDTINKTGNWFSRKILRRSSSTLNSQTVNLKGEKLVKQKRSISDLSLRRKLKKDPLKDRDLQELARLCGLSLLYLPAEYATGSLAIPTCFRATAQYLIQYGSSARGIFRIPGSHSVVNALYNHYCTIDDDGAMVAGTVRYPGLPEHIKCDVHDVASTFKRFLAGLPGGILGSLALFHVFVSIQTQLSGHAELNRTKQSKVRARLIALAIATLRSQYRRELICAVLGLLCMIGRAAETTRREDDTGRPLPTSDLMGYGSLSVMFGPLLVGDILDHYNIHLASPQRGHVVLQPSPPKSRKEKHKKHKSSSDGTSLQTHVEKVNIAIGVVEMLITHWRDVVRHMKDLGALKPVKSRNSLLIRRPLPPVLRPSASESFMLRKPRNWDSESPSMQSMGRDSSPTPKSRRDVPVKSKVRSHEYGEELHVKKQRSRSRPLSSQKLSGTRSMSILSPTAEEASYEDDGYQHKTVATLRGANSTTSFGTPSEGQDAPMAYAVTPASSKTHRRQDPPTVSKRVHDRENMATLHVMPTMPVRRPTHDDSLPGGNDLGRSAEHRTDDNESARGSAHPIQHQLDREVQRMPPPSSQRPLPSVIITKGSNSTTKVSIPTMQGIVTSRVRRIGNSEPGPSPSPSAPIPHRRPNARTQDLPEACKNVNGSFSSLNGDPLSRISHDDDIASLAKLAQALESLEDLRNAESAQGRAQLQQSENENYTEKWLHAGSTVTPKAESDALKAGNNFLVTDNEKEAVESQESQDLKPKRVLAVLEKGHEMEQVDEEAPRRLSPRTSWLDDQSSRKFDPDHARQHQEPNKKNFARPAEQALLISPYKEAESTITHGKGASSPSRLPISTESAAPGLEYAEKAKGERNSIDRTAPNRASGTSVSARIGRQPIATKGQSSNPIILQPGDGNKVETIRRGSSVKALAAKFDTADSLPLTPSRRLQVETPKKNLLASYTQNPSPSPSRSQNSMRSAKSTKSLNTPRKLMPGERTLIALPTSSRSKTSPPRRLLRSSLEDTTPLRTITKNHVEMIKPLSASLVRSSSPNKVFMKPASPLQVPNNLATFDGPSSSPEVENPVPGNGHHQIHGSSSSLICSESQIPLAELEASTTFNDPHSMHDSIESQLASTNGQFTKPSYSATVSCDQRTLVLQEQLSQRAEDLVHLTKQLECRINPAIEDLEHLKQQYANKVDPAVEKLTERLMETNREVEIWKKRAEVAEKRLEELEKQTTKNSFFHIWSSSSAPGNWADPLIEVSEDTTAVDGKTCSSPAQQEAQHHRRKFSEDRSIVSDRIRRALQGLDGFNSEIYTESSHESDSTVLRPRTPKVACGSFGYDDEGFLCTRVLNKLDDGIVQGISIIVPSAGETVDVKPLDIVENHTAKVAVARQRRIEGSESWSQTVVVPDSALCELE